MNVLVAAASKHGATAEMARFIGQTIIDTGLDVTVASPDEVESIDGYEAIVLGSAVYTGRWLKPAKTLAMFVPPRQPRPLVWLFSSGPVGDPPKPDDDPVDIAELVALTAPVEHRIFAGKIDKAVLGFGERAIVSALRVPTGDYRDWQEIRTWAAGIADTLSLGLPLAPTDPERG